MSLDPGGDHPHVREGVCTCPYVPSPGRITFVREPSATCGLSSHRIEAAAAAEMRRKD